MKSTLASNLKMTSIKILQFNIDNIINDVAIDYNDEEYLAELEDQLCECKEIVNENVFALDVTDLNLNSKYSVAAEPKRIIKLKTFIYQENKSVN